MENPMYIPTRDEIRAAHRQGEEATIQLFDHLARELQTLQDQLQVLQDQLTHKPSNEERVRDNVTHKLSCQSRDASMSSAAPFRLPFRNDTLGHIHIIRD